MLQTVSKMFKRCACYSSCSYRSLCVARLSESFRFYLAGRGSSKSALGTTASSVSRLTTAPGLAAVDSLVGTAYIPVVAATGAANSSSVTKIGVHSN